jgi:hypothetical protein
MRQSLSVGLSVVAIQGGGFVMIPLFPLEMQQQVCQVVSNLSLKVQIARYHIRC